MKVFIRWSGEHSKAVALALRDWLPQVVQHLQPWMSESDLDAGARWGFIVQGQLETTHFGIICLTRDNQSAPWILFEAGALAKMLQDTSVCPYLISLGKSEILPGPLTQFQAKTMDEEGTRDLLKPINKAAKGDGLSDSNLERAFNQWWQELRESLRTIPTSTVEAPPERTQAEMIEEIVLGMREIRGMLQQYADSERLRRLNEFLSKSLPLWSNAFPQSATGPQEPLLASLLASKEGGQGPVLTSLLSSEPVLQGTPPQRGEKGGVSPPELDPRVVEAFSRLIVTKDKGGGGTDLDQK